MKFILSCHCKNNEKICEWNEHLWPVCDTVGVKSFEICAETLYCERIEHKIHFTQKLPRFRECKIRKCVYAVCVYPIYVLNFGFSSSFRFFLINFQKYLCEKRRDPRWIRFKCDHQFYILKPDTEACIYTFRYLYVVSGVVVHLTVLCVCACAQCLFLNITSNKWAVSNLFSFLNWMII